MDGRDSLVVQLNSRGDTRRLGHRIGECVVAGDLIVLEGELGAGKTFLARAIARGLGVPSHVRITSPTFDLVHELPARIPLVHADLYRLDDPRSLEELGLCERLSDGSVVLVEWGERFRTVLGPDGLTLSVTVLADCRQATLHAGGPRGRALLSRLSGLLREHSARGPRGLHG